MEAMNDLKALLEHEVVDLMSAEDQIIEAMPAMIKKATNPALKKALQEHLKVTEKQRARLNKVQAFFKENGKKPQQPKSSKGFLSGLFGAGQKCRGMEGLITEGEKVMGEDMSPEVLDAAIIACAQKIEHYEICGYGTARAYARELEMGEAAKLFEETLNEEYQADDKLTALALGKVNKEAENGNGDGEEISRGSSKGSSSKTNGATSSAGNKAVKSAAPKKAVAKKAATKKEEPKKAAALRRR